MEGVRHWLSDPQASATLAVALVAALWAVTQFRPIARERRRETHDAMTTHYGELRLMRDKVVPCFPPLIAAAQLPILRAAEAALARTEAEDANREHLSRVVAEMGEWTRFDISFTAGGEIIRSEAKFRAFLWAIETIKLWRSSSSLRLDGKQYALSALEAAEELAHDLNAFLFHYETGGYPARQTLGLLHRSLAAASKAVEPVVWERSLHARWARRVLRIGVSAQHFNDVTPLHATSDLTWQGIDGRHLIHPRLEELVVGTALVISDSPVRPTVLPILRLRCRSLYWRLVGIISPTPRLWFLSYGGKRLRSHRRHENQLAGLLNVALGDFSQASDRPSLNFKWDLGSLKEAQRDIVPFGAADARIAWVGSGLRAPSSSPAVRNAPEHVIAYG